MKKEECLDETELLSKKIQNINPPWIKFWDLLFDARDELDKLEATDKLKVEANAARDAKGASGGSTQE